MFGVIIFGVVALGAIFLMGSYNSLIRLRNEVKNAFSQIDVQLKRRYDLIPNLVETAKASMKHERETLERVIQARNQALSTMEAVKGQMNAESLKGLFSAEAQVSSALKQFSVVLENYPDLKANNSLNLVMEEITSTENKVSFARQAFNDSVLAYNNRRDVFPANIVANTFSFQGMASFEIQNAQEREVVKVNFN
jgi:LemA protein